MANVPTWQRKPPRLVMFHVVCPFGKRAKLGDAAFSRVVGPRRCRRACRVATPAVDPRQGGHRQFQIPPQFRDEHLQVFPLT